MRHWRNFLMVLGLAPTLLAQQRPQTAAAGKPVQDQASSSFSYDGKKDQSTVQIQNVAYEVTGTNIPGRPPDEYLVLRKISRSKFVVGDVGFEATTTVEAWPLGTDLKQKPLYAITQTGNDSRTVDNNLLVFDRGTEEVDWWSVYQTGTGRHLFETFVPLIGFSISRDVVTQRYAGLEVPPDDAKDTRLKEPHVVGVVTYASAERVMREALITCDDPKQATLLRSYADVSRQMLYASRALRLVFTENTPTANPSTLVIPVANDDLDLLHAQLPPRVHVAAWKR
jgi:hypothetical protein